MEKTFCDRSDSAQSLGRLSVYALGGLEITFNDKNLIDKLSNKASALLCYLALSESKANGRDLLSGLFWDGDHADSSRYNLRYTIWSVRRFFKEEFGIADIILFNKNSYRIHPDIQIYSDVHEIKQIFSNIAQEEVKDQKACLDDRNNPFNAAPLDHNLILYDRIRCLYKGDFTEGFDFKNCYKLNDWIFYEKEDLQKLYFQVLHTLSQKYKAMGDYQKSIDVLREMLRMNPFLEDLHVELIRLYLGLGDRKQALTQYERCCTILRDELNVAPVQSTKAVYREIVDGAIPAAPATQKTPSHTEVCGSGCRNQINCYVSIAAFETAYQNCHADKKIMVQCSSVVKADYYLICMLLDEIFNQFEEESLRKAGSQYWLDVSILNSRALEFCTEDALPSASEKIRLFSSLLHILKILGNSSQSSEKLRDGSSSQIQIFAKNIKAIDRASLEFLFFSLERYSEINIEYHFHNDLSSEPAAELQSYIDDMTNVTILVESEARGPHSCRLRSRSGQ